MTLKAICVYCGSRPPKNDTILDAAKALGHLLAKQEITLVYGGGGTGMMGAIADAQLAAGGQALGIIPAGLASKEKAHRSLTEMRIVETMHQRKSLMAAKSDGFIAMPGGMGTLEELCEVTTWAQLGIHQKPVGILNTEGFFDAFLSFLDTAVDAGFLPQDHRRLLLVDEDPQKLLEKMQRFEPYLEKVWLDESEI